ncbi:MAG: class F sortase [Chloroflexota bacterium]
MALLLAACGGEDVAAPQVGVARSQPPSAPAASPTPLAAASRASSASPSDAASAIAAAARAAAGASPSLTGKPVSGRAAAHVLPPGSRLRIPEIGVDAPMVTLGVDANGAMQVPPNGSDVGWYSFSTVPGADGNAVISGHLNTTTSYVAVFTRLKQLKIGDPMSILVGGKAVAFRVFWTKAWTDAAAPLPLILGNAPSPTLTLITCAGTFNRQTGNYSQRLVVRAKLPGST